MLSFLERLPTKRQYKENVCRMPIKFNKCVLTVLRKTLFKSSSCACQLLESRVSGSSWPSIRLLCITTLTSNIVDGNPPPRMKPNMKKLDTVHVINQSTTQVHDSFHQHCRQACARLGEVMKTCVSAQGMSPI